VRYAQFAAVYPAFCTELRSMRKQTDDLANAVRDRAKRAGKPVPSRAEAAKEAGRIAQRACKLNATSGQGSMLDVNAAIIISMQIEKYKATAPQNYLDALARLEQHLHQLRRAGVRRHRVRQRGSPLEFTGRDNAWHTRLVALTGEGQQVALDLRIHDRDTIYVDQEENVC
jgi:hypothetical protein